MLNQILKMGLKSSYIHIKTPGTHAKQYPVVGDRKSVQPLWKTGGKKRNAGARGKVKQECLSELKIPEYLEGVEKLCQILWAYLQNKDEGTGPRR